ncbi:MAG: hypothetical protein RLY97_205, partial [Pseudomonadota bacterium]
MIRLLRLPTVAAALAASAAPSLAQGVSVSPLQAKGDATLSVSVDRLPFVHAVDPRYQSFQIGFSHLTGGETWKSYDAMSKSQATDISQVREPRAATDLGNRRLRNLTAALSPLYLRYSGTTANSAFFDGAPAAPAAIPAGFTVMLTPGRWKAAL